MLHPLYRVLLEGGVKAPVSASKPQHFLREVVSELCSTDAEILAHARWNRVLVYFSEVHVANVLLDDSGVAFEYEEGGALESDPRSNVLIHSVIKVLAANGDSQLDD